MKNWMKTLLGLFLGVSLGLLTGQQFKILSVIGSMFIDLLKMLVGVLVFSSIVTGICHIHDPKKLSRIGLRTILFYVVSTLVAIGLGITTAYLFKPGEGLCFPYSSPIGKEESAFGIFDFISSMIPANPFAALAAGNILQVIVFAVLFAFALIWTGERAKPVLQFFESSSEVMNTLTRMIMKCAPIGIFAIMATSVGTMGAKVIWPLVKFLLCNYLACFVMVTVFFNLALRILANTSLLHFLKGMKEAIIIAFTTCSSSATLPISMECTRKELGISKDISGFVLSLGSTVNMNGAAIGQSISAVFIAQAYGIELTGFQLIILTVTALLSAIGAAGIPGTTIVMLSVILNAIGLPLEGIALVAGIDRLREMVSTVVNILGDAVATLYIARKETQLGAKKIPCVSV